MDAEPLISVVMPVKNVPARHLDPAASSILAQTERRFEFLIVDDGSTDDTHARCLAWAGRDARIRVLRSRGQGVAAALNEGIAAARAEFIARMDGDDLAAPTRFAAQLDYLRSHPDCVVLGTDMILIDPDGAPLARVRQETEHEAILDRLLHGAGGAICHPAAMLRRSAVQRVGGYDDEFDCSQDLDLFLRLAEVGRLANLPEPPLRYRQHFASSNAAKAARQFAFNSVILGRARGTRGLPPLAWTQRRFRPPTRGILHLRWARLARQGGQAATFRKHLFAALLRLPLELPTWLAYAFGFARRRALERFAGQRFLPRQRVEPSAAPASRGAA